MAYTIPQNVYQPTISITNDDDNKRYMVVREIAGDGEKTVIRPGLTCRFKVPYQGLIIGYVEPKGAAE